MQAGQLGAHLRCAPAARVCLRTATVAQRPNGSSASPAPSHGWSSCSEYQRHHEQDQEHEEQDLGRARGSAGDTAEPECSGDQGDDQEEVDEPITNRDNEKPQKPQHDENYDQYS